jgi:phosphoglycolate phosphatase
MKRPRLVVFDFDGTLAETRDAVSATLNAALFAEDLPRVHPPFVHRLMGLPLTDLIARLLPPTLPAEVRAQRVDAVVLAYRARFPEIGDPQVRPLPGVVELLDALTSTGAELAIATSREGGSLGRLLKQMGLDGYFSVRASCERVATGKPAPDLLELALAESGAHPGEAWMVGDTDWDVQMARSLGVFAVGVCDGSHPRERLEAAGADLVLDGALALRDRWLELAP